MTKNEYEYKSVLFNEVKIQAKDYCMLTRKEKVNHTHAKQTNGHRDVK